MREPKPSPTTPITESRGSVTAMTARPLPAPTLTAALASATKPSGGSTTRPPPDKGDGGVRALRAVARSPLCSRRDRPSVLAMTPKVVLVVETGVRSGERVEVGKTLVIGRQGADFDLEDDEVSHKHARVRVVGDDVVLEDCESTNG